MNDNIEKSTQKIKYCKQCLYSIDHPLGLIIRDDGLCSGCRIHEEKYALDWSERFERLKEIIKPYKNSSSNKYDCIVPVTGDMESNYIMHIVKYKLGLNPLLVTYNRHWNTETGIRNLANLRIKFDSDIVFQTVNPDSVKNIVRTTIKEFGSIYWHCIAGQTAFPVQVAINYDIPLIIWGAHQGVEQVGMFSHLSEVEMSRRYRRDHDLMGYEADDLLSNFNTLSEKDIWQYRYPSDSDINRVNVRGIYLGNFIPWDARYQNEKMALKYSCFTDRFNRSFSNHEHVDCFNYMGLHDALKLYKCGFSKVTDHACIEIRHKRMTRDEGLLLVRKYEQSKPQNIKLFCDWLNVKEKSLQWAMDIHRNPNYWNNVGFRKWEFNGVSKHQTLGEGEGEGIFKEFTNHKDSSLKNNNKYIVFGKGY